MTQKDTFHKFVTTTTGKQVSRRSLVKGAAGQAIQNMNLMLGFPEDAGLQALAVYP